MKLLDRYLLGQFIKYFFTVNVGFVAIYLLVDFFEKIDNFSRAGKPFALAMKFFILNIPFIIDQIGPVLILLSGVISLGILNHTRELTALKAGGIPLRTIIRPLIMGGFGLTLLFLAAAQFLLPKTITATNNIWYEQVKGKVPLGIYRNGRYYYKGKEGFYSFEWPHSENYVFKNFSYSCWDEKYNIRTLLNSQWADWNEKRKMWILKEGQIQATKGDSTYKVNNFKYWEIHLPENPEDFLVPEYQSAELSLTALFLDISKKDSDREKNKAWSDFLSRISYIFLGFPLLLLGLPILLISYQKWGRDLSIAIPASCGIAFLAWGAWGALQSLARAAYISPLFAAVIIHLLFAGAGIYLLRKQDQ
ncbi:MAG: LptF/LptG family permease [Desulfoprunum sp.]|nr:LptF/LptG family permease [Desulfoprunum sp.]